MAAMTEAGKVLGPVHARWNDYLGTAAADDAAVVADRPSLYAMAGLDRDEWIVVAVELSIRNSAPRVTVFAVARQASEIEGYAEIEERGRRGGQVPVTAFHLLDSTHVEEFLNEAFERIAVRLIATPVRDAVLVVNEDRDVQAASRS